jgi:hypothetical protein
MTLDGTNLMEEGLPQNSHNWHESLPQGGTVFFVLTDTRSAWQSREAIAYTAQPIILADRRNGLFFRDGEH